MLTEEQRIKKERDLLIGFGFAMRIVYIEHARWVGFCGCWRCKTISDYSGGRRPICRG